MSFLWTSVAESLSAFYLSFYLNFEAWMFGAFASGFCPGLCVGWVRERSLYRQDEKHGRKEYRGTPIRYRWISVAIVVVMPVLIWLLTQGALFFVAVMLFLGTLSGVLTGLSLFHRRHLRAVVGCIGRGRNAITISEEREGPHRRSLHFQGRWWLWVLVRSLTCRVLNLVRLRHKKFSLVQSPSDLRRLLRSLEAAALRVLQEAELRDEAQFTLILASPIFLNRKILLNRMVRQLTRPAWEILPAKRTLPRMEAALGRLQFDWPAGADGVLAPGIEITLRRPDC